jgi:hypothetical protein
MQITLNLVRVLAFWTCVIVVIGCADKPQKAAYLVISKMEIDPPNPLEYQKFYLYLDVTNKGTAKSDNLDVTFYYRKLNADFEKFGSLAEDGVDVSETRHIRPKEKYWELPFDGAYEIKVEIKEKGQSEAIMQTLPFRVLPK